MPLTRIKPDVDWCDHSETHEYCEFAWCKGRTVGFVMFAGAKHALCAEHVKPRQHPPDLQSAVFRLP